MGGAASKCASSLLLADHEAKWLTDGNVRLAHGFGYDSAAFHRRTIGRRYVDDVIILSCSFCLRHMLTPAPLVVNVEGCSPRVECSIKWPYIFPRRHCIAHPRRNVPCQFSFAKTEVA